MPSGGSREGAGRPPKKEKHAAPIAKAEKKFADKLPEVAERILALAEGGGEQVTFSYEAAGTLTVEGFETEQVGEDRTRVVKVRRPMFPGKPADEMVLIKKTVTVLAPNLQANIYATDRIMGKPIEKIEQSGPGGGAIPLSFDAALDKAFGDPEPQASDEGDAANDEQTPDDDPAPE